MTNGRSVFYRNPDDTMESVYQELREFGVEPIGGGPHGQEELREEGDEELKERVVQRAYELIRQWKDAEIGITA